MDIRSLISQIKLTDDYFKGRIARTIDRYLTIRNWLIGFYIVEYEQQAQDRASYGSKLLQSIANKLDTQGLSSRNLKLFRQFYQSYPQIGQTVSAVFKDEIGQTVSAEFEEPLQMQASNAKNQDHPFISAEQI